MYRQMVLIAGLLLCAAYPLITIAQSDGENTGIGIQFEGEQINLYRVSAGGNFTPLQSLTGFYIRGAGFGGAEWEVARAADIVLSPDWQHLAFTAANIFTHETMLFLYRIGETELQRIPIPGVAQVLWSPDGNEILLSPPDTLLDGGYTVLEDAYLYTLDTSALTMLVSGQNMALSDFVWLPDGETIVYTGGFGTCDVQPCIPVRELYMVDRLGQVHNQLTDLSTFVATELMLDVTIFSFCDVVHPTWSALNNRLYYSLDCEDSGGFTFSTLMSISLNRDNRIEGQL